MCGRFYVPEDSEITMLRKVFESNTPVFTILTRAPSEDTAMIHDRMPVILPQEVLSDWLNPRYQGAEIMSAALTCMAYQPC